ncbi:tail fiber protein [Rapidithrix thailandica]|uniref:Tail fiber protein n=1 Tax=Rapidithrix thailandica TaxID=413964 RepID=A0AAW9RV23_9BACT
MKSFIIIPIKTLVVLLLCSQFGYAQWTGSGNDAYIYGKVGIGISTPNPSSNLHIQSPSGDNQTARLLIWGTGQNHAGTSNNAGVGGALISGSADDASFGRYNIGIESWYGIGFKSTQNNRAGIIFDTRNASAFFEGKVGIGTDNPQNKLSVNGTIWAKEVKVSLADAADWVFEEDYYLRPLSEVESFIKENKHLPEMPSAEEFRKNDLNVAEMDNKLLQKVEELTLYIIEQNKKLEAQQKEIEELKKKIQD